MIQIALTATAIVYGASMLAGTGWIGLAAWRQWRAGAAVHEPAVATAPIISAPSDDEETGPDPFAFDPLIHFCPACLCQWHEDNVDWQLIPQGVPRLCDDHARRLSQFVAMGQGALSRALLGWQHYADRATQQKEV